MYRLMMALSIGLAVWVTVKGLQRKRVPQTVAGVLLGSGTLFFFWFMDFWGEWLWFEALGYSERFWEVLVTRVTAGGIGAVFSAAFVFLLTLGFSPRKRAVRFGALALAALAGANWGGSHWETILKFMYAPATEMREPVFDRTVGFYLFDLPMADAAAGLLFLLAALSLGLCALDAFVSLRFDADARMTPRLDAGRIGSVYRAAGVFLLVLALERYLGRFHLMYSELGAVTGPGWTDDHIRLPAFSAVIALMILAGALLIVPPFRRRLNRGFRRWTANALHLHAATLGAVALTVFGVRVLVMDLVPALFQSFRVEPNEITFERPYIANNIRFTRSGFKLDAVEEREYPVSETFSPDTVASNPTIFSNIRLWDWRALDAVYKQFQEIRLYYEFEDVDVDRYTIDGGYRQVMVSAREMELDNLPAQSQTFVNRRFKYTHGYGITMTNVSDFTSEGLPDLLIRDIPPKSRHPAIEVREPAIYYGELTRTPVIVNTREAEFDYPKGDANATVRYAGDGGVVLENLWRNFLYGWKFDGLRLFLSGYPTPDSRILFHRQIRERVSVLAPFLVFDSDPYIVLADGRLYWIVDAYTTSDAYPYSERFGAAATAGDAHAREALSRFRGSNYVRNAVKAVVDAFDGSVDFYVFEPDDPLVRTWRRVFPDLFKAGDEMPAALREHVRYPADMLLLQGLVYAKYHMTDPTVFYNQEDLWVRATEKYYSGVQPVEPYYIIWELPGSDHPEFVLMMPFTPKNRQVSIGWIAGMCDGDNYGRFLAYRFPKEKRVLGPQQVETKIDQDRFLSGQLTLWDQRGSRVIRGNVLAIPVEETILYVEPIYLQAETAAYPELRLVALMHNDNLSYAESFRKALEGLIEAAPATGREDGDVGGAGTPASLKTLAEKAGNAFDGYLEALGAKRYGDAARALGRLESALEALSAGTGAPEPPQPNPKKGGNENGQDR